MRPPQVGKGDHVRRNTWKGREGEEGAFECSGGEGEGEEDY